MFATYVFLVASASAFTTDLRRPKGSRSSSSLASVASLLEKPGLLEKPSDASLDFSTFDWGAHWYPVAWARDVPVDTPTKVTLFDVDYCVVNREEGPLALDDRCPHRMASLSEGRVTAQGYLQCAYHGWAFNSTGACKAIPQVPEGANFPCAKAIPCRIEQGLIWLFPGSSSGVPSEIPRVAEMDDPTEFMLSSSAVRDMPVDYSLLVENILDPDHGLFAHQAKAFDMYTASTGDAAQTVTVSEQHPGLFELKSAVPAYPKLTGNSSMNVDIVGTSYFRPPCSIVTCRRDKEGKTKFITCFWVSPTGVGRSRFLSAGVVAAPPKTNPLVRKLMKPPRWLLNVLLNNFLDQDTHLLATQQPALLAAELKAHDDGEGVFRRRSVYKYFSPSERLLVQVGKFLDVAIPKMPNRYSLKTRAAFLATCPPREVTLDRKVQHTDVCPDSAAALRNCRRVRLASIVTAGVLASQKAARSSSLIGLARSLLSPVVFAAALIAFMAHKVAIEFEFVYPAKKRTTDLLKIPKLFSDDRYDNNVQRAAL